MTKLLTMLVLFVPLASAQSVGRGPCNTGRTAITLPSAECSATALVDPINPETGGPIVDGNWQIASPYPSAPINASAPDPCQLQTTYVGAPVNAPFYEWYRPESEISQWIGPNGGGATPAGWYVFRTTFLVPELYEGFPPSSITITGQLLADNVVAAMYMHEVGNTSLACNVATSFAFANQFNSWTPFMLTGSVVPATRQALYVVVYNQNSATPLENPTGLRVEFQSLGYLPN